MVLILMMGEGGREEEDDDDDIIASRAKTTQWVQMRVMIKQDRLMDRPECY
jgi:hypothetical protein